MSEKIKLDLINSRLDPNFGPRVYDSLEDANINRPEKSTCKSLSQLSFKSKEPKILLPTRNNFVPNIFDKAVIDCHGNYLDTSMRIHKKIKKPIPLHDAQTVSITPLEKRSFTPTLDRIKDKIHEDNREDLYNRVASKKLPGATWSVASRGEKIIPSNTGPGYYEVYESQLADNNIRLDRVAPGRGDASLEFAPTVPIKTRRRLEKIEKAKAAEMASKSSASSFRNRDKPAMDDSYDPYSSTTSSSGIIRFSDAPRFDALEYKQEPYVKTSGMILSPDFDKSFDKKITFSMRSDSVKKSKSATSLTGGVDVDVGHIFSIVNTAKKSPIKYAAAFK